MIGYISLLFFHVSILLVSKIFIYLFFCTTLPPRKHSTFGSFLHTCFSHTGEPRDRWVRGFQRGVRFSEDVRLIFQIFTVTVPTPANLLPQPQAVLLNHRLTNRPFHYSSLSLTGRESSSNAQVSVSSTCSRLFFLFSFSHFSHEDPSLMPPVFFLFSFVVFFPKVKKLIKK